MAVFFPGLNVNNLFILASLIVELHLSASCAPVINLILEQCTIPTQPREQSLLIPQSPQLNHRLSVDYVKCASRAALQHKNEKGYFNRCTMDF